MTKFRPGLLAVITAALAVTACTSSGEKASRTVSSSNESGAAPTRDVVAPLTVDTTSGKLHGLATPQAREFLGVRYAKPMAQRWTLPQPPEKAQGIVQTTKPPKPCAQKGFSPGSEATYSTDEDCLFANVTTPNHMAPGKKLPVMVWSHGGGYTSGSAHLYDAQRLASQGNVIVVTVNKRLGVFGYLGLPGLTGGGDFGLADVVAALKWAKANASAFGGDPANITLFGESDGAMSSCALLTSPQAKGLFDKLALSSGGTCQLNFPKNGLVIGLPAQTPYTTRAISEQFGLSQAKQVGCTGADDAVLACLRRAPTASLLKIFPVFANVLAYDTPLLPRNPATAVRDGYVTDIPVLSGVNQAEERSFVGGPVKAKPSLITAQTYPALVRSAYGSKAPKVLAQYPTSKYLSPAVAYATIFTDSSWACPTLAGNAALVEHGNDVYGYEFADSTTPDTNGTASKTVPQGATHATDLPYLFDIGGKTLLTTDAQRRLSARMIAYWSSFARNGKPSAPGAPPWPRSTGADGPTLQLAPAIKNVDLAAEHNCQFWTRLS